MNELIYTDNIALDFYAEKNEYRLSLFDVNGHYVDEIYFTPEQLKDLIEQGKNIEIVCNDDDF
jgi:hypothetical protein